MLLVHQAGSVKVGELVRYTLTYTPASDRILPTPSHLHVKIKNTSAIALRAAYLRGPYTLHVAAYPSTFNPNQKVQNPRQEGVPEFEPYLKAGGSWTARLNVPEDIRETGGKPNLKRTADGEHKSVTWIVEVTSQIIFSNSASVNFELLVGRDERSLDLGFAAVAGHGHGSPGQVQDHQQSKRKSPTQPKGVYSKAVKLVVEDTTSLWNKPPLPEWSDDKHISRESGDETPRPNRSRKQKKLHLVVVTHGLHSNLGADMLYLKESIDATAKQARANARKRRKAASNTELEDSDQLEEESKDTSTAPLSGGQDNLDQDSGSDDDDDEQVIVRGFNGNAVRTEKGIQYLGKRLAKYVLRLTYPSQPYLPVDKSMSKKICNSISPAASKNKDNGVPSHEGSSIENSGNIEPRLPYTYTSISFIGHSLGGVVQTYAIAYIYKHSPHFFETIKPVNFIALASPFLGLSNENPMYVKFALDFGLVGRTGQDLGLVWRPPTLARSGWSAMVGGLGVGADKNEKEPDPGAKPLLRILPTGPAHQVLKLFRNRTLYSNVVNDGIVPLRTSCLLFLDWRGLGKVEKARRENGLIGTMAAWGLAEITGQNSSARLALGDDESRQGSDGANTPMYGDHGDTVPQPSADITNQDDQPQVAAEPESHQFLSPQQHAKQSTSTHHEQSALDTILSFFRPSGKPTSNDKRMYKRSQTLGPGADDDASSQGQNTDGGSDTQSDRNRKRPPATRGDSILGDPNNALAPPKTTVFESAGDLLSPPIPPMSWIVDPASRARTIFHDRVYHPEDIPPPPTRRPSRFARTFSSENGSSQSQLFTVDIGGMRVEEKIARAYHRDLSWRKVLVRLEPDAHNNIIVRRMFANAYGWPVVKHLCDTHFADTYTATTRDENEPAVDRAKGVEKPVGEHGEQVKGQEETRPPSRSPSEMREVADELKPLKPSFDVSEDHRKLLREDSARWDDAYFGTTDEEEEDSDDDRGLIQKLLAPHEKGKAPDRRTPTKVRKIDDDRPGTSETEIKDFLTTTPPRVESHRGLMPSFDKTLQPEPDSDMAEPIVDRSITASPPPLATPPHTGGTTELGLRKSIEEQLGSPTASPQGRQRSGSHGITEQVVRLSMSKDRE